MIIHLGLYKGKLYRWPELYHMTFWLGLHDFLTKSEVEIQKCFNAKSRFQGMHTALLDRVVEVSIHGAALKLKVESLCKINQDHDDGSKLYA